MSTLNLFSPDYATARQRFRTAATGLGWQSEAFPIHATGPAGEELTIDVTCSHDRGAEKVLVVTSGVHGVEGFFGSAVQTGLLEKWRATRVPSVKCVFIHGINPFGFAWLRRFDENNVDPNRNFLLNGEKHEGSPPHYASLNDLLNPRKPPSRWEPFTLKALLAIARFGMPTLRRAIAVGQYEFPQGLFFGGAEPTESNQILGDNMPRWLDGSKQVVHLDFHTGLGPSAACKLLIDTPLSEAQQARLVDWYGVDAFEASESSDTAYLARGGFGPWCVEQKLAPDYLFATAEYGTYGPIKVLAGLRAENQAHHWGNAADASSRRVKHHLKELFCPSADSWRSKVLDHSFDWVLRAANGLANTDN